MDKPSRHNRQRIVVIVCLLFVVGAGLLVVAKQNNWWVFSGNQSDTMRRSDPFGLNPAASSDKEAEQTVDRLLRTAPADNASEEERTQHYATLADAALQVERCDVAEQATEQIAKLLPQGAYNRYPQVYQCYLETDNLAAKSYRQRVEESLGSASETERAQINEQLQAVEQDTKGQR